MYAHISIEEREKIQQLIWSGTSMRGIAKALNRSHSSILREIRRHNPEEKKRYTPRLAEERALLRRKSRGRKDRLKNEKIREYVVTHLKKNWSPEQISGRMRCDGIGSISHEAIYQYIYAQVHRNGWGLLRPGSEDLRIYLRRRRKRRMKKGLRKVRVFKPKGPSIHDRPSIVNGRKEIGHWEGDSVEGENHTPGVNTLVERKIGFTLISKLKDKTSEATVQAMEERFKNIPDILKKTVTLDNGPENSAWQSIRKRTGLSPYYADPYSAWQRPTNENTNGLIREYFPKGTDFRLVSEEEIQYVEYMLNTRPRKRLGWRTPLEVLSGALQS
jgi:IS30 family transposase